MPPKAKDDKVRIALQLFLLAPLLTCQTFGMKNKKGGKAQKYIQTVNKQAEQAGKNKEAVRSILFFMDEVLMVAGERAGEGAKSCSQTGSGE